MKGLAFLLALLATSAAAKDLDLGLRHLVVITGATGDLDIRSARGFAGTAELWVTPRISTELSIGFVNPEAILRDLDLGTIGLQTTALTARWNFRPDARLSGFAGGGVALVKIGNLDDQFGDEVEADFDAGIAFIAEGGLRLRLRRLPRLAGILVVSYMPLSAEPNVRKTNVALPAELSLDPLTFALGATWRF